MRVLIGFSTSRNPLSKLIRWVTRSKFSHAFLLYQDPLFGLPVVLEAGLMGFRPTAAPEWWRHSQVLCVVDVQHNLSAGFVAAGPYLGARYDVEGLLGGALVVLGRWFKLKWRNPSRGASQLFCSEVLARILQWAKFPEAEKLAPDEVTPQDLFEFLKGGKVAVLEHPQTPEKALEWVV